jgi:hypothetical protein
VRRTPQQTPLRVLADLVGLLLLVGGAAIIGYGLVVSTY